MSFIINDRSYNNAIISKAPGGFSTGGSVLGTGGDRLEKDAKLANPPGSTSTTTQQARIKNKWSKYHTQHTPQPFYGPFSGTTRVSRCQKTTSGLYGARED